MIKICDHIWYNLMYQLQIDETGTIQDTSQWERLVRVHTREIVCSQIKQPLVFFVLVCHIQVD